MTTLYTVGYEPYPTPAELAERLRAAGVRRVVDVRALPRSRRRGFSKTALAAALAGAGIAYEHARDLGTPKEIRTLYKGGRIPEGRRAYTARLRGEATEAVDALGATLGDVPTAVMCLEEDPERCHRSALAAELAARDPGLAVVDL